MSEDPRHLEPASGNPHWERSGPIGLPRSPAPAPAESEPGPDRSVASWLGWSPTSWRSRGSR
jgi:hypothetical protein